ncbi:MAG: radical SAM family heme chaperone HemW [Oscillospiraceae bacterium]|nr:radical SAM family heme chaperone HemW [Oscillospiraceae bacterium]
MQTTPIGLYIHVPFCDGKCPYCDFFSMRGTEEIMDEYTNSIIYHIKQYKKEYPWLQADTLYFGGGTPSLLGSARLCKILDAAGQAFGLKNAEITIEANPDRNLKKFFREVKQAGANRISLGLQSADRQELHLLGRKHTAQDAARAVEDAHTAGIDNVSLDLMLAVPGQTPESLRNSIQFCLNAGVTHLSAYLLRVEEHTAFWQRRQSLSLPDEEQAAQLYETACAEIERGGLQQYEISNFAQPGKESRHNLKYWDLQPYLGLGPAAHSFFQGKRFYWPRSLRDFLRGTSPLPEEDAKIPAGSFREYAMLRLRLTQGLTEQDCQKRYRTGIPDNLRRTAKKYEAAGLTEVTADSVRLTAKGFLVSNALLAEML